MVNLPYFQTMSREYYMTLKQQIKEYVDDHFTHFGFYPYEVEVDGQIYSYGGYWEILEDDRFD